MNPALLDFDIAFAESELDRVFVVSDPHFGHANIIKYCHRPFADADEMDRQLIARWNAAVPPAATVWLLGDVTVKPEKLGTLLRQLNGRKILVAGNHDQPHPVSLSNKGRQPEELAGYARAYRAAGFDAVHLGGAFTLPDFGRVLVCHYPYSTGPDHLRVRFPDDGETPLLHGHVHDKWRFRGRMLNAGVEVQDYRPVSLRDIRDLFRAERAAGWPTLGEPEDEKPPNAPATALPPNERYHWHEWFIASPGEQPLPDQLGIGTRTFEMPDAAFARFGWPVDNPPTLLEVWFDGADPDGELLRRKLYLHPRLTPAAYRLLRPRSANDSRRQSVGERIAAVTEPRAQSQYVLVEVPAFEVPGVLKWLASTFTVEEPMRLAEDDRNVTIWKFAHPSGGASGWVHRARRTDEFGQTLANSDIARLHLEFPPGTTEREAAEAALLFRLGMPLRDWKSLSIPEPA